MKGILRKWGFAAFFAAIIALVAVEASEAAEVGQDVTVRPASPAIAVART